MNASASPDFANRWVTLCDGRSGLRSGLSVDIAVPPSTARPAIDFVVSSETLDRYDEILLANGWRLDNYRRNPVFQNAHQYGDIIFTLGKALVTEVRPAGERAVLFQRVEFAVDINPLAKIAYGLYQGKFLNAVSVGFIPLRWENGTAETAYRRKYLEQELLEVSAVGLPANPEALQLGLRAGAIEKADLRDVLDLLRQVSESPAKNFGSHPAVPPTLACASGRRNNEAQWLPLVRELRRLLSRS